MSYEFDIGDRVRIGELKSWAKGSARRDSGTVGAAEEINCFFRDDGTPLYLVNGWWVAASKLQRV